MSKNVVTDGRLDDTIYTLNLNGSPLKIEDPGGVTTEMSWTENDIYKESETGDSYTTPARTW